MPCSALARIYRVGTGQRVSRGSVADGFYLLSDMLLAEGMADMIMRVRMGELLGDMGWRRGQVSGGAPT